MQYLLLKTTLMTSEYVPSFAHSFLLPSHTNDTIFDQKCQHTATHKNKCAHTCMHTHQKARLSNYKPQNI